MDIIINIGFKKLPTKKWSDSMKRAKHLSERISLRGIGVDNIKEAVQKGAKKLMDDGTIVAEFRWYKVAYREFHLEDFKKVYPITVMEI